MSVIPELTGLRQVSGRYSFGFEEMVEYGFAIHSLEKPGDGFAAYRENHSHYASQEWVLIMRMNPNISIIICTLSRADLLRRTLMSLEKLLDIQQAEVIIIDNNALDDTAEVVLECIDKLKGLVNLRYVFEPQQGLSVARNTGINEARAPIIAFLDGNTLPFISWLPSIRNAFLRYPDAAAIGGVIIPNFDSARPDWLVQSLELPYTIVNLGEQERRYPRKLYPFGANMAFRREVLQDVYFPESPGRKGISLHSGDEAWIFQLLRKKGLNLYYIPGMKVRHHISEERLTKECGTYISGTVKRSIIVK